MKIKLKLKRSTKIKKIVKLFFFPIGIIMENKRKSRFYLFGFIPMLEIKYSSKNSYNNTFTKTAKKMCRSVGENLQINGYTIFNENTTIGDCCTFNGCEIQGAGKVKFGSHIHTATQLLIIAQNHNYDSGEHIPFSKNDFIYKDIEIGDFVWIGSRVTILPGTKIGEGAIIQAGAVVHGEIPPLAIAGGNPAKVFKYRDKEHFEKLKKEGKFNIN